MKSSLLLSAALVLVLPAVPAKFAFAQETGGVDTRAANTRAARKAAEAKKHAATDQAPEFPNATRVSPEQKASKALAKQLQSLMDMQEKEGVEDEVIAKADAIIANPEASPFDKSSAAYIAASAWQNKDTSDYANAIKYYQIAIDANGLHNNSHYRAMMNMANMMESDGKHEDALKAIDRYITETKSEDASAWNIKARALASLDRPAEAAAALEKLAAAKPDDKAIQMALASAYMQADQDAKAAAVFDRLHSKGMLTESKDYEAGFRLLANIDGRKKDALALIEEGMSKGIMQPSAEAYDLQAHAYYDDDNIPKAIEYWAKGAPLAKSGDMYLNLAQMYAEQSQWAQAKDAAQRGKDKGVKRMGVYWQTMARAENGLGNKAASTAALKEAAKYPETKKWAEAALRQGLAN
jgi:tetratricopeptide (TPR) repeat protein